MNRRIAVRGIVFHDERLFAVRLNDYKGKELPMPSNFWCLPGGKLEPGESLADGVAREMLEETGVPAQVGALLYIQQFAYDDTEHLEFFFHVTNSEDYLNLDLSKSSHGAIEIAAAEFIDPAEHEIRPTFLASEAIAEHIAANQPPKLFSYL